MSDVWHWRLVDWWLDRKVEWMLCWFVDIQVHCLVGWFLSLILETGSLLIWHEIIVIILCLQPTTDLPTPTPIHPDHLCLREVSHTDVTGSIRRSYIRVQKALLNMLWNIRPIGRSLPLIGWEQSSPVDEEKIKMDDGVARFFTRFGRNLFICWLMGGAALSRRPRMR